MEWRTKLLGLLLLLLGSVNTLVSKYQVRVKCPALLAIGLLVPCLKLLRPMAIQNMTVVGTTAKGEVVYFQHPSVQCGFMFLGEFLCLLPYFVWKWILKHRRQPNSRGRFSAMVTSPSEAEFLTEQLPETTDTADASNVILAFCPSAKTVQKIFAFFIPAACDAAATIMLYTGLMFTYASTFQMLRGTMVLWCGLLTICVLRRNLHIHHWVGICMIAAGSMLVIASSVLDDDPSQETEDHSMVRKESVVAEFPLIGAGVVMFGQLMSAVQYVVEERYLAKYHVPALLAVGLEGFWGLILCFVVLPILSIVTATDGLPLDDVPKAFQDIMKIPRLQISFAINMVCVAVFNFLALVVTSELSTGWRAAIDTLRTLVIWTVSAVVFEWEYFHGLQVVGFAVLVAGMSLYNELMRGCLRHSSAADETVIGSTRNASNRGQRSRPEIRTGMQEPLLNGHGEPLGGSPSSSSGGLNMPAAQRPCSPRRPPLHPNSFDKNGHFARSLTYNPDVLSPHSLGSYSGEILRSPVAASDEPLRRNGAGNLEWPVAASAQGRPAAETTSVTQQQSRFGQGPGAEPIASRPRPMQASSLTSNLTSSLASSSKPHPPKQ